MSERQQMVPRKALLSADAELREALRAIDTLRAELDAAKAMRKVDEQTIADLKHLLWDETMPQLEAARAENGRLRHGIVIQEQGKALRAAEARLMKRTALCICGADSDAHEDWCIVEDAPEQAVGKLVARLTEMRAALAKFATAEADGLRRCLVCESSWYAVGQPIPHKPDCLLAEEGAKDG